MTETYRLRRSARIMGPVSFVIVTIFFVMCPIMLSDGPLLNRLLLAVVLLPVFGILYGGCFYYLLFCRRHRLTIDELRVRLHGVRSVAEVDLSEVTRAVWRGEGSRSLLKLFTPQGNLKIKLDGEHYLPDQIKQLVCHFRQTLPEDVQEGWLPFCHALKRTMAHIEYVPTESEVRTSRRRADWVILPWIFIALAISAYGWYQTGLAIFWVIFPGTAAISVPFWLMMRLLPPSKLQSDEEFPGIVGGTVVAWFAVLMLLIFLGELELMLSPDRNWPDWLLWAWVASGVLGFVGPFRRWANQEQKAKADRLAAEDGTLPSEWLLDESRHESLIDVCIVNDRDRSTGGRENRASVGSPATIDKANRNNRSPP